MRDETLGWRSWAEQPPQIPWAPILIRNNYGVRLIRAIDALLSCDSSMRFANLEYAPTGIYREEFFSVTGQWV